MDKHNNTVEELRREDILTVYPSPRLEELASVRVDAHTVVFFNPDKTTAKQVLRVYTRIKKKSLKTDKKITELWQEK